MANVLVDEQIPDSVVESLGMPKKEITFVTDAADGAGQLAQTKDGNTYIILGDGRVQLYVPAHPTVKLPIETYRPGTPDLGLPVATPVAPEVALAVQWRQQQLEVAAKRDGLDLPEPAPIVTDPLAEATVAALVTDAGPQPSDAPVNENPADQKPDEPSTPQPAEKVVKKARKKQAAERAPKA